ncbi:hypothetical protein Q75_02875 [Bacillus coahuilensis p1.1.43]|uniref:UvrD-like helicase ATP-binding domain-containing protein n=1 Tax=Bacillus coahuilensis p1.1.43 TaxID=1150625 RepID=A0A147KBC2_9BACI|nr:UvrD-helicase domain-containing protein [Bacillus coahuilensis]KUP08424.1 hypothetical protein Q75_02875 [Bacillus coahuilensis p1.1.43]
MSKKLKPTLVIAGPGAGKTHYVIKKIIDKLPLLEPQRFLAVITYTNSATNEIKERLSEKIVVPPNVFIGTIHSFLVRFILKPYGVVQGVIPNQVVYKDVSIKASDRKEENIVKSKIVKKGIIPYEKIVSLSSNLLKENKRIRELISQRLQYLFVDEFQDANSGQFNIFEEIRKASSTEMYFVGDPEQSIMTFQNQGSQIQTLDKRPIYKAMNSGTIHKEYLDSNNRSSTTIIDFINNFHTSIIQSKTNEENKSQNKVTFIVGTYDLREIINSFNSLCNDRSICEKNPSNRFFLGYRSNTFQAVDNEYGLVQREDSHTSSLQYLKKCSTFVCEVLNISRTSVIDNLKIDDLTYRQLCLKIIDSIKSNPFINSKELISLITTNFKCDPYKSVHKKVQHNPNRIAEDFIKKINLEFQYLSLNIKEIKDYHLTIHKSKGLQADAVLVVAKSNNEVKKVARSGQAIEV